VVGLTKGEYKTRIEQIKITTTVPDVLRSYGVDVKRGRCKAICHDGYNYTAKVTNETYYCFKCNESMDIFDITMHFNHCDFNTAFELLGGAEKPSFTTWVKANKAKRERDQRIAEEMKKKAQMRKIHRLITAYRIILGTELPMSDLYVYCYNKLQYQIYLLENLT
jgi:DNA primase